MLLADVAPGHVGTVLRISDRDSTVLTDLAADAIGPGVTLTVVKPLTVQLPDGQLRHLSPAAARLIWVTA